jgi:hypothetical protein
VCSPFCAREYAEQKRLKKERKEYRVQKEKLKSKSDYEKSAERACNSYIRARDRSLGYGCVSCGTRANVQYAAGHYRTVKACPELRYHEWNINLQCHRRCNKELSGNILEYRLGLIERYGEERVDWLERHHDPKHYTIENLQTIERWYKRKLKRLLENNACLSGQASV